VKEKAKGEPDAVQVGKGHGRVERREVWVVESGELGAYLAQEYGWPDLRWCGRIRRFRKGIGEEEWKEVREHLWVAGGNLKALTGDRAAALLRGHWGIENRVFRVRDVDYDEDRLHGRAIGLALSAVRDIAINLLRRMGFRYIPDGQRDMAARSDRGLSLLTSPILLER